MKPHSLGIALALTSSFSFGIAPIFTAIATKEGSNGIMTMLLRNILSLPIFIILIVVLKLSLKITKKQLIQLIILNLIGATVTGCLLYSSYIYTGVGLSTALHFVYPVLIMIGCLYLFKEKPNKAKIIALVLSILGIIVSLDIKSFNIIGFSMAIISGFTYAFYVIYLDKTGLKYHNVIIITFYSCIINAIAIFIFSLATNNFTLGITPKGWFASFMVAILASVVGIAFLQAALQYIDSPTAAIMCTMEPVTSVVLGILILHEGVGLSKIIGCILIISAVLVIAIDNKRGFAGNMNNE